MAMMGQGVCGHGGLLAGCLAVAALMLGVGAASAKLPDGRRYELVTPVSKNAADVLPDTALVRAAPDGSAVGFASLTGFGDVRGVPLPAEYIAVRGSDGRWRSHAITPTGEPVSYVPDLGVAGFHPFYVGEFSSDLSHGVFLAKTPLTNAPNVAHAVNLYLRNDLRTPGPGSYQLLSDASNDQGPSYDPRIFPMVAGASADFSHVTFESKRNLLPETTALDPAVPKLYEWVDGSLRLAGWVPAAPAIECGDVGPVCVPATSSQAGEGALRLQYTQETISSDGRRVIFTTSQNGRLYLRDDQGTPTTADDTTIQINASERITNPPDSAQPASFQAASTDCTKMYFTTKEKLTDEDPNSSSDLYRYDATAQITHLTRVSVDTEPADNQGGTLANGHNVAGAIGASHDGNTVYFAVVGGQLLAGGSTTPPVGNNTAPGNVRVYRWQAGTLHEVADINNVGELNRILGGTGWDAVVGGKYSRVSSDGRYLAFLTQGTDQLLSLYGKPEQNHGDTCAPFGAFTACLQAYLYDADANNGQGDLQCASCDPNGAAPHTNTTFRLRFSSGIVGSSSHLSHALTDNGLLFFNSAERLTHEDKNNEFDVYEFNPATGQRYLLTSGTGTARQVFLDATPDGTNAYLYTRTRLRSEDHDQNADIYDARINGTIDPGLSTNLSCEAENCRPAATPTAHSETPASNRFQGPGSSLAPPNPAAFFHTEALTPRQRRQLSRRGETHLTITTSASGTITIRVKTRIKGHTHTIQTLHRALERAGVIHPQIQLNASAQRRLSTQRHLHLLINTTYSQSPTPQQLRVTLRNR